ncbi:MAG: hypothetical protein JO092_11025, partial [Candidatus Eremiobacteraeota bacterium]|nr:hypothetical protein [Candidatus Eremiobacteraeota bacterium]
MTPIGAYLALCGRTHACLLESVDRGGRLARRSFIGLDYRASASFEATDALYERVREFVLAHRVGDAGDALGAALLVFGYDAARPAARLGVRIQSPPVMPAAYVAIPST